jgi:hypothetical protein
MRAPSSSTVNQTTSSAEPSSKLEPHYPAVDESLLLAAMKGAADGASTPMSTNSQHSQMHLVPSVSSLLQERQQTHGSFEANAAISQHIKSAMRLIIGNEGWYKLDPVLRESLEQIALKLSRISTGAARTEDHWRDIAGYATLAANFLSKGNTLG